MIKSKVFQTIKKSLILVMVIALAGCGDIVGHMYGTPPMTNRHRQNIVSVAQMYIGCPAGKNGKKLSAQNCPNAKNLGGISKFDCSNFTKHVYNSAGFKLDGTARTQCKNMIKRGNGTPAPGDLVCFGYKNKPITHIGIAISDGKFIHAATVQNKQIKVSDLTKYKKPPYVGYVSADGF